ncbi:hypothetical protein L2K70_15245 [Nocardioides KLBMP 9356]|uniref:DUF4129 domain-containing protein n=1 Tax=Nocardioides potassii TaxID=2911371 RepID=A0ABS9HCU6_9ACTN|nr:hypothetical protein [Nocardioides potassii]MCF6378971.1 hypothetical protein [Nocardioides potassii]
MRSMLLDVCGLALLALCLQVVWAAVFGTWWRWQVLLGRAVASLVRPRPGAEVVPLSRPIEQVAADVRRLRAAFDRPGLTFAKWEGTRQAYDDALAEAADILGEEHRLLQLRPGTLRDFERQRLERLLERSGLRLRDRAA